MISLAKLRCSIIAVAFLSMLVTSGASKNRIVLAADSNPSPLALDQDAFLKLARANDAQIQGRLWVIDRSGIDEVQAPPFWKYPDLAKYMKDEQGNLPALPDSIRYRYRETYCNRGGVVTFEQELAESSVGPESPVNLSPYGKWSNRGGIVRKANGKQNNATFSIHRDEIQGQSAEGVLRFTQSQFALGVGYATRVVHVESFRVNADRQYHLTGTLELMPGAVFNVELLADADLIVRKASLRASHAEKAATVMEFISSERADGFDGIALARFGTCRTEKRILTPGDSPDKAPVRSDDFRVDHISLSEPLSEMEYDRFSSVVPDPDGQINDPQGLIPVGREPASSGTFPVLISLNVAALFVFLSVVLFRLRRDQTKNDANSSSTA